MKKRLIVNTALLTGASLLMRCIGMVFQAWLAGRIGAAGIGLYQLVMSVEVLATTFAISGIRFAATRLVAEEIGLGRGSGVGGAMYRCAAYSLIFGAAACGILYIFAEPIGFLWIGDARTVMSLRILSFGLPFIALSSVLSGYFTACGRIWKPSLVHLLEQLICAALVVIFLGKAPEGDIERSCASVAAGVTAADMLSLVMMLCFYVGDRRRHGERGGGSVRRTSRMFGVALPLAVSAYARSALSTLEHLLVPRGFRRSGLSADAALAGYGVIQGMAMPIIGFPSCLLSAVAELMIPTLTEAQMRGDCRGIRIIVSKLLKLCVGLSLLAALLLWRFGGDIGEAVYGSEEAGRFIRLLAPLVPMIYTDMVIDGCLKGLGQQVWSMAINILDAALGVLLVWHFLPLYALNAYIAIIYFNEALNFTLSALRLRRAVRSSCRV